MKRSRNALIWIGFAILVLGLFSYPFSSVSQRCAISLGEPRRDPRRGAASRDRSRSGLARAAAIPGPRRGTLLAVLAVALVGFSSTPRSSGPARSGVEGRAAGRIEAPDFTLPDQDGNPVTLSRVLLEGKPRAVVLVFYRGFW
jgi:hypothetical protein